MKAPSTSRPSSTPRQRILESAHDLFYSQGIRATGVDLVIARAQVTKVTFYRQFPSKDDLVAAYLEFRHDQWMAWLRSSLAERKSRGLRGVDALLSTLGEWWSSPTFRGCAFVNAAVEIGPSSPLALEAFRRHKEEFLDVLLELLPVRRNRVGICQALSFAVDGSILHAQAGMPPERVETGLRGLLEPWLAKGGDTA